MAELPNHYFPSGPCPYKSESDKISGQNAAKSFMKFSNYGSHVNLDIKEDEHGSKAFEFTPLHGQREIVGFTSIQPSLPLFDSPLKECWRQFDSILGVKSYFEMVKDMRTLVVKTKIVKSKLRYKRSHYYRRFIQLRKLLNSISPDQLPSPTDLNDFERLKALDTFTNLSDMSQLSKGLDQVCKHNESCLSGYNPDFYGGLLCHLKYGETQSSDLAVHAHGEHFTNISLSEISSVNGSFLTAKMRFMRDVEERVYQVAATSLSAEPGIFCTRGKQNCKVFRVDTESQSFSQFTVLSIPEETFSSVIFSPFLSRELLLSTSSGSVYLWDINARHQQLIKQEDSYSRQWNCSYFAGHPRQIATADNSSLHMFDHRSKFSKSSLLYTPTGSRFALSDEIIRSASLIKFPHHVVVTSYGVLVIDQRFTQTPVLQWAHELGLGAPQYTHVFHSQDSSLNNTSDNTILFVASQMPDEIMCFPMNITTGQALNSSALPFRVGRPGDVFLHSESSLNCDYDLVQRRFETSLAGLSVTEMPGGKGFVVYQMDSYGDIFYQPYWFNKSSPSLEFLSMSSTDSQVSEEKKQAWITTFADNVKKERESIAVNQKKVIINNDLWSSLFSQETEESQQANTEQTSCESQEFDYSNLPLPKQLSFTEHLPSRGANSKLLLAQKNGENFTSLLENRELEYRKLRKAFRKMAMGGSASRAFKSKPIILNDSSDSDSICDENANVNTPPKVTVEDTVLPKAKTSSVKKEITRGRKSINILRDEDMNAMTGNLLYRLEGHAGSYSDSSNSSDLSSLDSDSSSSSEFQKTLSLSPITPAAHGKNSHSFVTPESRRKKFKFSPSSNSNSSSLKKVKRTPQSPKRVIHSVRKKIQFNPTSGDSFQGQMVKKEKVDPSPTTPIRKSNRIKSEVSYHEDVDDNEDFIT